MRITLLPESVDPGRLEDFAFGGTGGGGMVLLAVTFMFEMSRSCRSTAAIPEGPDGAGGSAFGSLLGAGGGVGGAALAGGPACASGLAMSLVREVVLLKIAA